MKFALCALMLFAHSLAAVAFSMDANFVAASAQLAGAGLWGLMGLVLEEI